MRVESVVPKACRRSIEPTITLEVKLALNWGQEVPTALCVEVLSDDERILGTCHGTDGDLGPLALAAEAQSNTAVVHRVMRLMWTMTPRILDEIQEMRDRNSNGDVQLKCKVTVTTLCSRAYLATLKLGAVVDASDVSKRPVYYVEPREPYSTPYTNLWVLSGAGSPTFLEQQNQQNCVEVTIRSSDWIHEFDSVFRSTRYLVVELPMPECVPSIPGVPKDKLDAAIDAGQSARERFDEGEWSDVVAKLRPVWELVRDDSSLRDLLMSDGYPSDAAIALNDSVRALFTFSSKFVHRLSQDRKDVTPAIKASREDALLCYSFAITVLNLFSRKAARLARTEDGKA
ncbi:MAG: hypothetical protein JNK78_19850 [Planctomycetes bacterium]|nr:hypothetical protein [Planctomycetota bacterium]